MSSSSVDSFAAAKKTHGAVKEVALSRLRRHQGLMVIAAICLGFLISASWLVFPYLVKGQQLLGEVGGDVKRAKLERSISIGNFLSRTSFGAGEAQVDVLYATAEYFQITDRASVVDKFRPDQNLVFFVTETTHIEELPTYLPRATLWLDGEKFESQDIEGPLEVFHHRVLTLKFPAFDERGQSILNRGAQNLRLELQGGWDPDGRAREFNWALPIGYPEGLQNQTAWTPLVVLGLSSGLLSFVLTPCLLQLLVVYMMTFTGISAQQVQTAKFAAAESGSLNEFDQKQPSQATAQIRKKMLGVGVAFVAGFAILFMLMGAAIGYAGKEVQMFFAVWSQKLSIGAGILVIFMGIWIGIRARAPMICRLVPAGLQRSLCSERGAYISSALTAIGFSLGCLTCFGGAIIATLLVYVGALGSAFIGAMVMLAFSMGVVIPFLLGAFFLSHFAPLMTQVEKIAPKIGFVSMLVIVAFGLVLATDNFHVLSDFIYPYLQLS